jgi:carbamoylphosphate synthase large subunit
VNAVSHQLPEPARRRVLVTGAGGPAGAGAIAALRALGYHVLGADMRDVPHGADSFALLPAAKSLDYCRALRELIARERIDWLVPTVSEELVPVARIATKLRAAGVRVFMPDPRATAICDDKWHTAVALAGHGVAVPRSSLNAPGSGWLPAPEAPLLTRPRVGRGGRGVVVHERPGTEPAGENVIWQEFLPGTEYDVVLLLHPERPHQVLCLQVLEKLALREGRVGNAVEVLPVEAPDIAATAIAAACALTLAGPVDIDIRRGSDGLPRVLEINARLGAHAHRVPELFQRMAELDCGAPA